MTELILSLGMETSERLLCRAAESVVLLVDIQERLVAAMKEDDRDRVLRGAGILAGAAALLEVPRILTEQYPKGLGPTAKQLLDRLYETVSRFEKTSFSCCGADGLVTLIQETRRVQVILAGMESHVCVLQTAMDLIGAGLRPVVAEDAICSRNPEHHANAVARMRQAGVVVANTESIVFEWLRDARHEQFKAISALVK